MIGQLTHAKINEKRLRRPGPFGPAWALLPKDQQPLVIDDDMPAYDAIDRMDEIQQAIDTGEPYQTRLDPPPGPPTDTDGNFIPMAQWDEANWPEHVHQPRVLKVLQGDLANA